ncbi:MAG: type II toxin-antitoxin system VapC family toxin [Planctomycetota bacterium]
MKTIYLETSIFGYLTGRPSRDLLASARQQITERWWHDLRHRFELFVSPVVVTEAGRGDSEASQRRLSVLIGIPQLVVNVEAERLAEQFILDGAVPKTAPEDALHIALAAVLYIDYLLTWNCRHIDNSEKKPAIRVICAIAGYQCPEICTPEELMGELSDE